MLRLHKPTVNFEGLLLHFNKFLNIIFLEEKNDVFFPFSNPSGSLVGAGARWFGALESGYP